MKWISVKERMPERYTDVFVYDGNNCYIGYFTNADSFVTTQDPYHNTYQIEDVTHWMPLPKLPKEE